MGEICYFCERPTKPSDDMEYCAESRSFDCCGATRLLVDETRELEQEVLAALGAQQGEHVLAAAKRVAGKLAEPSTIVWDGRPERGAEALPCSCGGYAERVEMTDKEDKKYGCGRPRCCGRAFVCRRCKARIVGCAESPDAG